MKFSSYKLPKNRSEKENPKPKAFLIIASSAIILFFIPIVFLIPSLETSKKDSNSPHPNPSEKTSSKETAPVIIEEGAGEMLASAVEISEENNPDLQKSAGDTAEKENKKLKIKDIPLPDSLSSKSYLVASLETGEIFAEKNSDKKVPIASITKLITALLAKDVIHDTTPIKITPKMLSVQGFKGNIKVGDTWIMEELYYPLLLESDNHAAHTISTYYGQKRFVEGMDAKAQTLGMKNTSFVDSSGLKPGNISTAYDLFILARHLIENTDNGILETTKLPEKKLEASKIGKEFHFKGNNPFRNDPAFLGGKNGFTYEANKTLMTLLETDVQGETHNIVIVTLGSNDHTGDTKKLFEWFQGVAN